MVSNIFKYLLGFILAIAILIGGGVATALYFMNRTSIIPPKPIYTNDNPVIRAQAPKTPAPSATKSPETDKQKPDTKPTATPTPTPTPTEDADSNETKPLPPGAYQARVTWSQGLSLRAEPKTEAQRVGGVGFNQKVIVVEESDDKVWQKIRLEGSNEEGWVKAGNTKKSDEQDDSQQTEQTEQNNSNQ